MGARAGVWHLCCAWAALTLLQSYDEKCSRLTKRKRIRNPYSSRVLGDSRRRPFEGVARAPPSEERPRASGTVSKRQLSAGLEANA